MTIQEFNNTKWGAGMRCIYDGQEHKITSVDFTESLIEIQDILEQRTWVRCENVSDVLTIIPA